MTDFGWWICGFVSFPLLMFWSWLAHRAWVMFEEEVRHDH